MPTLSTREALEALPLGTRFWVHNGHWHGRIVGTAEEKGILVEETGVTHAMRDDPRLEVSFIDWEGRWSDRPHSRSPEVSYTREGDDIPF